MPSAREHSLGGIYRARLQNAFLDRGSAPVSIGGSHNQRAGACLGQSAATRYHLRDRGIEAVGIERAAAAIKRDSSRWGEVKGRSQLQCPAIESQSA